VTSSIETADIGALSNDLAVHARGDRMLRKRAVAELFGHLGLWDRLGSRLAFALLGMMRRVRGHAPAFEGDAILAEVMRRRVELTKQEMGIS